MVWLEHLALLRDASAIDLVASAIVKVLRSHEEALAIAAVALLVPLEDICDLFVI